MISLGVRRLILRGVSVAAIFGLPSAVHLAKVIGTSANPFAEVLVVTFLVSVGFWFAVLYATILLSVIRLQRTCRERTRIACELAIFAAFVIASVYVGALSRTSAPGT